MLESKIQAKIINYLKKNGWLVLKIIKCNINGMSDLIVFKNGKTVFIEVKNESGKQSEIQKYVQKQVELQGFQYLLINDISQLNEF
jgi:Holliday junction resolvase-like predicted endonuclease